jgi:recombination protein RecA
MLEKLLKDIQKKHGTNSVMMLNAKLDEIDVIPTGSLKIDNILGVGGLPKGKIVEIYGIESSGKTTLCLQCIAKAQKNSKKYCGIIDTEHALDLTYAKKLGVDVDRVVISQPDHAEQALSICEEMVESELFDIVMLDSVAALSPKAEIDGEMGDSIIGLHARLMSQALRKLTSIVAKTNTLMIFTNQVREKIGVMFGNPETTPGGKALKFFASVRIELRKLAATIKEDDNIIGNTVKVKIVKSKVSPPFKEAIVKVIYNEGISPFYELTELCIDNDIINKGGSWLKYGDYKIQGEDNFIKELRKNEVLFNKLMEDYGQKNSIQ